MLSNSVGLSVSLPKQTRNDISNLSIPPAAQKTWAIMINGGLEDINLIDLISQARVCPSHV